MQALGNLCIALAGFIYVLPVQYLLHELAHKRDDGGGAIAGFKLLVPMWALLLVGLLFATARGGFDWLPLKRGLLYALVVGATLSLAFVTFASLVSLNRPTWTTRLTIGLPIYLVPPLTIALIAIVLNTVPGSKTALAAVRLPWTIVAGLSLAGCVVALGYQGVRAASRPVAQFAYALANDNRIKAEVLARIPTLDPELEFFSLLNSAAHGGSPEIRASATARLRTHPNLMPRLIEELGKSDPTTAITFAATTDLSAEERRQLALPLHAAMQDFGDHLHDRLHLYPKDWLRQRRTWGRDTYPKIASKFDGTGVDFASLPAAFDRAFIRDGS